MPIEKLLSVMRVLRTPETGCPWDLEQDHASLARYCLEEAYEVVGAISSKDKNNLKEELGDLLLQVVFHAQIACENGDFDFEDIVTTIYDKLIRRHPHVFENVFENEKAATPDDVDKIWQQAKSAEKKRQKISTLYDLEADNSDIFPATIRATMMQNKAARENFQWGNLSEFFDKVEEELHEFKSETAIKNNTEKTVEEFGDLLFSMVNLGNILGVDTEISLSLACLKFNDRYQCMRRLAAEEGADFSALDRDEMLRYWGRAKQAKKVA